MDLFIPGGIPVDAKHSQLARVISARLHAPPINARHPGSATLPLNFDFKLYRPKRTHGSRSSLMGNIHIPLIDVAQALLVETRTKPLLFQGVPLRLQPNNRGWQLNKRRIDALLEHPFGGEAAVLRQQRIEDMAIGVTLQTAQLGCWTREAEFSCEHDLQIEHEGRMRLYFEHRQNRRWLIVALMEQLPENDPQHLVEMLRKLMLLDTADILESIDKSPKQLMHLAIPIQDIAQIYIDEGYGSGDVGQAILALHRPAILINKYGPQRSETNQERDYRRLSAVSGAENMSPFVLRLIRLAGSGIGEYLKGFTEFYSMRPPIEIALRRTTIKSFGISELESVCQLLRTLPIRVAFQAEKLLLNGVVLPRELEQIIATLRHKLQPRGSLTASASSRLESALIRLAHDDNARLPEATDDVLLLSLCVNAAAERARSQMQRTLDADTHHEVCHVQLTPTTRILTGPITDQTCRILRKFSAEYHPNFISVAFCDEGGPQAAFGNASRGFDNDFVTRRWNKAMKEGLQVGGHKFEYFAYSQSSMKEGRVWFIKPFVCNGQAVTPASIIAELGDFSHLLYLHARYFARVSQALSTTAKTVEVAARSLHTMPDVERNGYCFTDGAGTISSSLAERVRGKLRAQNQPPSAVQVRLGGAKGMLFVDPTLRGDAVYLRPSMTKFESPARDIEVCEAFAAPKACFLNRNLVCVLETLGVPAAVFLKKQAEEIREIDYMLGHSYETAAALLQQYGLGGTFAVPQALRSLWKLGKAARYITGPLAAFLDGVLLTARLSILREIKFRCRVQLSGCWSLVGGVDESNTLREGEVYIAMDNADGCHEGAVMVAHSPLLHPGDIRLCRAVRPAFLSPFLAAQRCCIIFSQQGARPECNKMAGGDLDGDLYHVVTDAHRDLWPPAVDEAAVYPAATISKSEFPATNKDAGPDWICKYLSNDVAGQISSLWLRVSDDSMQGARDPNCLKLSALNAVALDFPKSGTPASLQAIGEIRRVALQLRPDFLQDEQRFDERSLSQQYYASQKALGQLYRAVQIPRAETDLRSTPGTASFQVGASLYFSRVRTAVARLIGDMHWPDADLRSQNIRDYFCDQTLRLCQDHSHGNVRLTECELWISAKAAPSKDRVYRRKMASLNVDASELLADLREALQQSSHEVSDDESELYVTYLQWRVFTETFNDLDRFGACILHMEAFTALAQRISLVR